MSKITADHLSRGAFVYVRQSTADQLLHNPESRRRQYGLADRARQLGWNTIEVIDDDLGRSAGGTNRVGFERLLAAICDGRAGAVFAIEASRLARNGRDWHTLIEFCGLVGTVIVDEDGSYDPRHPNDRLLTGSRKILISACSTPSGWSLPSSPSCKACDRYTSGCETRELRYPPLAIARCRGTASFGNCRSTTPCTIS